MVSDIPGNLGIKKKKNFPEEKHLRKKEKIENFEYQEKKSRFFFNWELCCQWIHFDHLKKVVFRCQDSVMMPHFRSGFLALFAVFLLVGISGHSVSAESRRPKNVQVALRAKWSGTSLLLEAGYVYFKES